ncbi:MAG: hypothetical protein U9N77_02010 [Thermodesulfobacteriota bacterium]|nr:hypothetical protein [Thermodesulfobacteriota bacterium]
MGKIILKTDQPNKASEVLLEALEAATSRFEYSLSLAQKRLLKFEKKYKISSEEFINTWTAENLSGKDMEYVEWVGEYQFSLSMKERLNTLHNIKYVA